MFRVFIGSLITAIVLFMVGGVSALLLGTNKLPYTTYVTEEDWVSEYKMLLSETFIGERTWTFSDVSDIYTIEIDTSDAKTYLAPSDNGELCITGQSNGWNELSVEAEYLDGGVLRVTVGHHNFGNLIMTGNSGTVTIGVPDAVYETLNVTLGTGSFAGRGISSLDNRFDIGSGSFEYEQKSGFEANRIVLDMGSGTAAVANAAANYYTIDMGSGSFNVSGLTGSGDIIVGSGSGTAQFAKVSTEYSENIIDLGSGHLTVYIPDSTRADLYTDIGSGSVVVDCCGITEKLHDDAHVTFNGGSNDDVTFRADLGSGKIELLNSSEYARPDMFEGFPSAGFVGFVEIGDSTVEQETASSGQYAESSSQLTGEVTLIDSDIVWGYATGASALETTLFEGSWEHLAVGSGQ